MPVLYLTEAEVRQVLTMEMALEAVEIGLKKVAFEEAVNIPRTRCQTDHAMLHLLSAAAKQIGYLGFKAYTTTRKTARFHLTLYDGKSGEMVALMQADYLGQVRTGAASGVATRLMARPDAQTVGLIGSGKQARTQLQAMRLVRNLSRVEVYSPNAEHRQAFAQEMTAALGVEVVAVDSAEQAVRNKDIVITATTSRDPVLHGDWLAEGTHLNVIGSNFIGKSEVDVATIRRADIILVDSKDQATQEAGDFVEALKQEIIDWSKIHELGHALVGRFSGRERPEDITLFKSLGIGIEDVVVAARVLALARQQGLGRLLDIE